MEEIRKVKDELSSSYYPREGEGLVQCMREEKKGEKMTFKDQLRLLKENLLEGKPALCHLEERKDESNLHPDDALNPLS